MRTTLQILFTELLKTMWKNRYFTAEEVKKVFDTEGMHHCLYSDDGIKCDCVGECGIYDRIKYTTMKKWITEIRAISPATEELGTFSGPSIEAASKQEAIEYCENNGLGYCRVTDSWEPEQEKE